MANTFKFGNGQWAVGKETALAYNDENSNFKPLPFSFDRASTATVVNKNGLIETVGVDEPRIDFLNNTKGHLLLEPQRSNLFTYSDDFGNSDWDKGTGTITTNTSISPDGTLSADKYSAVSTSSFAFLSQTKSADASQSYTYSIWIKKVSGSGVLKLAISDVNLATLTSNNINLTNEFVRYSFSIETGDLSNTGSIGAGFINITSGDVIEVWGAQLEQGSYATSYIPTSGSAVTRVADSCYNAGNDQVINSTEGVLYLHTKPITDDYSNNGVGFSSQINLSDGNLNNGVNIRFRGTALQCLYYNGLGYQAVLTYNNISVSETYKVAFLYKQNDFKMYVNGVLISSDTNGSIGSFTLDRVTFDNSNGVNPFYGNVKDIRYYNTALSDSELQALTS